MNAFKVWRTSFTAIVATTCLLPYSSFEDDRSELNRVKSSTKSITLFANCAASAPLPTGSVMVSPSQTTIRSLPPNNSSSKSSFFVVWDNHTRNPLCTVEKLQRSDFLKSKNGQQDMENDEHAKHSKTRPPFYPEPTVSTTFRVNPKDYNDCKYDRGHMAPAADFAHSDAQYKSTFTMANISPQAPFLNRGIWGRLEAWIRHYLLQFHFEEVIVVTGPVFAPVFLNNQWVYVHKTVGTFPHLVTVPTHYYKVILGRPVANANSNNSADVIVAAFLFPNHNHVDKMEPLANLLVRLDQLESIVGYHFFPSLLDEKDKEKIDGVVPGFRDLAVLLNAHQQIAGLPAQLSSSSSSSRLPAVINGDTAVSDAILVLTGGDVSIPPSQIGTRKANSNKIADSGAALSATTGLKVRHLCGAQGIDCQKPMFPPK